MLKSTLRLHLGQLLALRQTFKLDQELDHAEIGPLQKLLKTEEVDHQEYFELAEGVYIEVVDENGWDEDSGW